MFDRRRQPSPRLRAAVLVSLLALASAAASAQAVDEPYEVPVILSLTGQAAFTDRQFQQSLVLVEKQINATGGVARHPLKLVYYDDASNPQVALTLASQQIAKGAPLLLGPGLVATCQAVMPLVVRSGPVTLCYSGLIQTARGGYMFAANISAVDQYRAYLRFLRARGWLRISLVFSTDATGQAGERAYDYLLGLPENRAFQVVSRDHLSVPTSVSTLRSNTFAVRILTRWSPSPPGRRSGRFCAPITMRGSGCRSRHLPGT